MSTRGSLSAGRPSNKNNKNTTLAALADTPPTKRVNFDIPSETHTKLKIYAAQHGKTVKALLTEIVENLVK